MALVESTMMPLGTVAPAFRLMDTVSGKMCSLEALRSPTATVIFFICNHCPFVQHIIDSVVEDADLYQARGIAFIAISANDPVAFPDDAPDKMTRFAQQHHFTFPYLFDETQTVAKAYGAACTPDFMVFDSELKCVYRGQYCHSRPGNTIPITGEDLTAALDALLSGKSVSAEQYPSMGCNIKWKSAE